MGWGCEGIDGTTSRYLRSPPTTGERSPLRRDVPTSRQATSRLARRSADASRPRTGSLPRPDAGRAGAARTLAAYVHVGRSLTKGTVAMGPLAMLYGMQVPDTDSVYGHSGESAPMSMARQKMARMFGGMTPGAEDDSQMSPPVSQAQAKIAHMFSLIPGAQGVARRMEAGDESQMSAPRQRAQNLIDRMFGGVKYTPNAPGDDRNY